MDYELQGSLKGRSSALDFLKIAIPLNFVERYPLIGGGQKVSARERPGPIKKRERALHLLPQDTSENRRQGTGTNSLSLAVRRERRVGAFKESNHSAALSISKLFRFAALK